MGERKTKFKEKNKAGEGEEKKENERNRESSGIDYYYWVVNTEKKTKPIAIVDFIFCCKKRVSEREREKRNSCKSEKKPGTLKIGRKYN